MIQDDIGEIVSYVAPALEKVQNAHSIIQKLSEKVPNQTKMKEAISQMEMHLGAAAKISATLDFKRGFGNTDCVSTVNIPTSEPTDLEPGKCRLRSDTSTTPDSTNTSHYSAIHDYTSHNGYCRHCWYYYFHPPPPQQQVQWPQHQLLQ